IDQAICNGTQSVTLEHPYHGSATLPCFRNSLVVYQKLSPNLETGRTPVDYRTGFALDRPAMDFNFTQADQMSFWTGLDFLELLPTYFASQWPLTLRLEATNSQGLGKYVECKEWWVGSRAGGYPMHAKDCRTGTLDEYTFVELNNAQFGLFSNLSCAQPLSPWWQSQCDGKNLIKLAADSNGAPRWMPDLPADNATESGQVSDACTMDAECSSENMTVCIPRGSALTPQCGCANLQDQGQPVCTITVDMSIVAFNVTFDPVPVRGCASRYTATIRLKHASGSADIPEAAPPTVLANFFSYFLNKSSSVYPPVDQEFYLQHNPVTVIEGNLQGSYKLYEEFEFVITANFTMPEGGQCVSASYLCIGFSASENETVRDSDPTNNAFCMDIDSVKVCQPIGDTEISNFTLFHLSPNPLVRHENVSVSYHLSVLVKNLNSPIMSSEYENNFMALLYLVTSDCQNLEGSESQTKLCLSNSVFNVELKTTNESVFKSGYTSGDTFSVSVHAPLFEISQNQCNKTTHFCVLLTSSVNSSYSESNISNSLACHPVETFCTIISDAALETVALLPNATDPWVPEYRHTASFSFGVRLLSGSKIDPVLSPSINFEPNISFLFQNASTAPLVMEGINCIEKDRTQGIQLVGQIANVICDAAFLLTFQQCTTEQVTLRVGMINSDNPSYVDTNLENNWKDITISKVFDCAGGAYSKNFELRLYTPFEIEGVEIKINKSVLLTSEQFPLQLTVQNGTDVTYTVNMTDGTSQVIVHPEPVSYAQPINITHTFNAPGVYDIHVLASSPMNNESSTVSGIIVQNPIAAVDSVGIFSYRNTDHLLSSDPHRSSTYKSQTALPFTRASTPRAMRLCLAHSYSTAGNYTVIVNASNPVSWQTAQISPIVVLNPLVNVSVTYRQSVLWPFEGAEFVINNEPNMQAGLVVCDFEFSTYGSKRIFIENLTDSSNAVVTFEYSVEAIGTQRVSMSCWNPLSIDGLERNFSIVVLKDSVKIANFSTNGTVWLGTPVEFVLDMTSFPNDTCIHMYYNQTSLINEIFGAHNSCRSIATPNSPAYTQVSPSTLRITWKRDLSKVGVYSVLVFAYNNVSNDSAQTFATVIDIPCYKPRLRLFDSDSSSLQVSSVQTIRRSEQINLTAVAPYNCSKLTNISTYWTIIAEQSSTQLPLCTDNSDQCLVQRRMLPYGLYNVSFTAELTVDAAMAETAWILLNVSKTPLSLEAITGPEYVSFNQTFVLNASATATDFDVEDGDLSGMTFQWSCFQDLKTRALSELRGCFGNGPGVVYSGNASIAGSLTVNSFDLVPNASYVFRVRLTKDTREVWQSKTVFVESQPKPVGRLDCEQNCGAKVVAKRPLVYRLVCEQNCGHKFFTVSSNLTIVRLGVSGDEIEGTRQSSSDGQELSISAGTLMESSYYRVMGQLWNLGQETSYLVANITVNGPPVGGTCRVDPPGVVNIRTLAHLTCANWTEFGAFVAPLAYSATLFRWNPTESPTRFDSSSASFPTVLLPVGASNGLGSIEFKITDSFYAEAIFTVNISSAGFLSSGDYSAAAVTLKSIALAMNAWNEDAQGAALSPDDLAAFQLQMATMRLKYLKFVDAFPFNFSSDALQMTTSLLRLGTKTLRKVIEQARIERANLSHKASEEIQDNQLKSGLSIWNASGFWAGNYSNRSMVKGVMLKTLDCIDSIGLLALESVSNFTKVEPGFALMGITQDVQDANVTGAKVETDMGSVSLPRFSAADPSGKCNITFMMSAADPYHWSQSESKVTTSFLRGRSQGCSFYDFPPSHGRSRRSASSSPTYEMQLAGAQVPLLRVAKTPTDKWLMMYHSFNATGEVVQLVIQPDAGHQLEVFLHEGTAPDPLNYTLHRVVPQSLNSTNDTATKELIFIPADMFSINQTVFVGVRKLGCSRDSSGSLTCSNCTLLYHLGISTQQCYAWDSGVDEWRLLDSAKCQASEQTAVARPAFKVNLFGSIGAGISFVPNTIDFGELFENWQGKLSESRAVLSVVIVLWVLFIPLAVLLRRMDLRDAQKFQFLPLKDEREQKGFVYKIEVFNGSKRGYEVPVGVFISVKGLNASELLRTLDDGERRNFESGGVDNFLMTTKAHLGDIRSICLTFDKTESGAGRWYVSRLIVTDCTNDNKYIFVIEDWLSPGIDSAVNCASSIDLKFSKNLVRNHLSRRMQDDHIWFSMLRRKVDTNFSRLQRLGVCWSLLFMTMIANAMWYEVADSSSEAFRIG
uniref:PKD1 protein n=1 Tax=Macrostomum lignano TaxID=282301 RepID=A0A1I8GE02_9PLAT